MNLENFVAIAKAAGIDIEAHGGKTDYARALGCYPAQVSTIFSTGTVTPGMAKKANSLAVAIKEGLYKPAAVKRADAPVIELPENPEDKLTDEQLTDRINQRFKVMMRFVEFAVRGNFRSVLITGPGGIGKTYPIEQRMRELQAEGKRSVVMVSGAMSGVGLYASAWATKNKGDVLVIDDADGNLQQGDFANTLKAMTDSKGTRVLSWLKQNQQLAQDGIDASFEYRGAVIIISNINMAAKAERNPHVEALLSRAQHIDLGVNSARALALRVKHMIQHQDLFAQRFASADLMVLYEQAKEEIGEFIVQHSDKFRSLTLREAVKIADMYIATQGDSEWGDMALLSLGSL